MERQGSEKQRMEGRKDEGVDEGVERRRVRGVFIRFSTLTPSRSIHGGMQPVAFGRGWPPGRLRVKHVKENIDQRYCGLP
jgi:hypothetical protein